MQRPRTARRPWTRRMAPPRQDAGNPRARYAVPGARTGVAVPIAAGMRASCSIGRAVAFDRHHRRREPVARSGPARPVWCGLPRARGPVRARPATAWGKAVGQHPTRPPPPRIFTWPWSDRRLGGRSFWHGPAPSPRDRRRRLAGGHRLRGAAAWRATPSSRAGVRAERSGGTLRVAGGGAHPAARRRLRTTLARDTTPPGVTASYPSSTWPRRATQQPLR